MPRKSALDPEEVQSELERLENLTPGEVRFSSGSMSRTLGLSSLVGLGLSIAQRQWLWENLGPRTIPFEQFGPLAPLRAPQYAVRVPQAETLPAASFLPRLATTQLLFS